jgi:hypothetical protein
MQSIALELERIIDQRLAALQAIPETEMGFKPSPVKWSKKEIMGHMIDSAQNNIRRFIVAQYEEAPKIVYNQDKWVEIAGYQHRDTGSLINLWYLLNKQICEILKNTATEMYQRQCQTEELHSIEWLARDYNKHLLHHLHAVLDLEPVAYR